MTDRPVPSSLPAGFVTFLLTDIEGSTAHWERVGDAFAPILASHHGLLRTEFGRHGGREVKEMGDGFLIAFERARAALACAVAGQRALAAHSWPAGIEPPRVRMALHSGEVELREGEYRGLVLHYAQRMLTAGYGGQILCSESTASLLGGEPTEVRLVNLGCYHLRGAAAAFRLFQVEYPDMPEREFPLPDAIPANEGSLPLPTTRFFGRQAEMARLQELLGEAIGYRPSVASPESALDATPDGPPPAPASRRLVTVTGPGGAGKTRLALQAAARIGGGQCRPIWFVPLADLADPLLIGDRVLAVMGLPRDPALPLLEQVIAVLSAQPGLLVLDNFEHLVKGGSPLVQALLEGVPALTLLVTSRRRLRLPGEYVLPVPPLVTPGESDEPERVLRSESVRMFADRAQVVRPDFQITKANAAALATLCRELEGLPLAIELAAARSGVRTPQMMLEQLQQQRFEILVSRQHKGLRRQSSLWAAIDWSYQLLPPEWRQLFARLSVFRGGWTAEAAEAVCGDPWNEERGMKNEQHTGPALIPHSSSLVPEAVLNGLEELRESALVLAEMAGGDIRFRLLETLREFGARQLSPQEQANLSRRHAEYYVSLAEQAEPELARARQGEWLERLERDHDNFRAALDWCLETVVRGQGSVDSPEEPMFRTAPPLPELTTDPSPLTTAAALGLRLGAALWLFWRRRGYMSEGRERLSRLLAMSGPARGEPAPPDAEIASPAPPALLAVRARVLHGAGSLSRLQGDFTAARSLLEESLAIRRKLRDRAGIADTHIAIGFLARFQSDYEAARASFEESLMIARLLDYKPAIAASLRGQAEVACTLGEYALAGAYLEESLSIERELENKQGIADSLADRGWLAQERGELDAARAAYEQSLAIRRELNQKTNSAALLSNLGQLACQQGDGEAARRWFEDSLSIWRRLGDRQGLAWALNGLGEAADLRGEYAVARSLHEQSLEMRRVLGDRWGMASCLQNLARVARHRGDPQRAAALCRESLALFQEQHNRKGMAGCLEGLGEALVMAALPPALPQPLPAPAVATASQAARLLGAAQAARQAIGALLPPADRGDYDQAVAAARDALGEAAFAAAWAEGSSLPLEQAAEWAQRSAP